jgi:replication factor C subunit 1
MKASSVIAPPKLSKDVPDIEDALEEEDENDVVEPADVDGDEELDLKGDKYIKQPKVKKKTAAKKTAKADEDEDEDDDDGGKPAKARGKGATRGRGRPKKA